MNAIKYFLIFSLFTVILGQLLRLPFAQTAALTATDVLVISTGSVFILISMTLKRSLKLEPKLVVPVLIFSLYSIGVNIYAATKLPLKEIVIATLFLMRFLSLFFITQIVAATVKKSKINNWASFMLFIGVIFAILGFLQFIFIPDLSFLTVFGWDPHQKRIVSTFLDPNYAGLAYVFFFNIAVSYLLFSTRPPEGIRILKIAKMRYFFLFSTILFFTAIVLTFSRSTYLAFLAAILIIGMRKSPRILLSGAIIFFIAFFSIPQMQSRVIGALSFDETSQARIQSWKNGINVLWNNPIFGVGFNTYRYTQAQYNTGLKINAESHSASGVDSSLILVAATTGVFGLFFFTVIIYFLTKITYLKSSLHPISLAGFACLTSLLVHSQFVNSIFFPQTMLIFWFVIGLILANDS